MSSEWVEKPTVYFRYCGEVNTDRVLEAARKRCEEMGIGKVVVASETGRSALRALKVFEGSGVQIIVVTHYPAETWGPKGEIPIGLGRREYRDNLKRLLEAGVRVVQGCRPFAPPSRSIEWGYPTPECVIDKTLEIFGAGTKIAVEAAVMATDAGEVDEGEVVVSCAGTYKGLDTALVVKAAYSGNFFRDFVVMEVVAKPTCRVRRFPEYRFEGWKGNLDDYYREVGRL